MRKTNIYLMISLALAMIASLTLNQVNVVSAQTNEPVGIVAAYNPGRSITIIDQSGNQHEYMLSTTLKVIPPGRAASLAVGSFVTVIAPASLSAGKQTAVGIVVHPHIPPGWTVAILSPTAIATLTSTGSETATLTSTPAAVSETATLTETPAVETATNTETPTATPDVAFTSTPTPTATPLGGTNLTDSTFIEWLRTIIRQVLNGQ